MLPGETLGPGPHAARAVVLLAKLVAKAAASVAPFVVINFTWIYGRIWVQNRRGLGLLTSNERYGIRGHIKLRQHASRVDLDV